MTIFILFSLSLIGVLIGKRYIKKYGKDDWMTGIQSLQLVTCFIMLLHIFCNDEIGNQARELCYIEHKVLCVLVFVSILSCVFLFDNDKLKK